MQGRLEEKSLLSEYRDIEKKNYYERLGLTSAAQGRDIKEAYNELALKYHPDKKPVDNRIFPLIDIAYKVLINPARRAEYNATLEQAVQSKNSKLGRVLAAPNRPLGSLEYAIQGFCNDVAISERYLAAICPPEVMLFCKNTGALIHTYQHRGESTAFQHVFILEQSNTLIMTYTNKPLEIYELSTGENINVQVNQVDRTLPHEGCDFFFQNRQFLASLNDRTILILKEYATPIYNMTLSSDKKFCCITLNLEIHMVNLMSVETELALRTLFHVLYAELSPDSRIIAYCGQSNRVVLYQRQTQQEQVIQLSDVTYVIHSLNFSPNAHYIVIAEFQKGVSRLILKDKATAVFFSPRATLPFRSRSCSSLSIGFRPLNRPFF